MQHSEPNHTERNLTTHLIGRIQSTDPVHIQWLGDDEVFNASSVPIPQNLNSLEIDAWIRATTEIDTNRQEISRILNVEKISQPPEKRKSGKDPNDRFRQISLNDL